jgi:hypothetical protein
VRPVTVVDFSVESERPHGSADASRPDCPAKRSFLQLLPFLRKYKTACKKFNENADAPDPMLGGRNVNPSFTISSTRPWKRSIVDETKPVAGPTGPMREDAR